MKIAYVQMKGFRGFQGLTRIEFPTGFAIVTGRNGTGKSTICDAVEFALTGGIRASTEHREKGESIGDYLWWRGAGIVSDPHVELGLSQPDGKVIAIRRTPSGVGMSPAQLVTLLVAPNAALDNPIARLCRTTILRDEEITTLSVALRETDRFEFVRGALGTADFGSAEVKLKRVTDLVKGTLDENRAEYERQRDYVAQIAVRLSQTKLEVAQAEGLEQARIFLQTFVPNAKTPADVLVAGEKQIVSDRVRVDALTRAYARLAEFAKRSAQVVTSAYRSRLQELNAGIQAAESAVVAAGIASDKLSSELHAAQRDSPRIGSLAQLHEHGRRVGLQNGRCPLCGTVQEPGTFETGLGNLEAEIRKSSAKLAELSRQSADAVSLAGQRAATAVQLRRERDDALRGEAALLSEQKRIQEELRQLGFEWETNSEMSVALLSLANAIEQLRTRTNRATEALTISRASEAGARLVEGEQELASAQLTLDGIEKKITRLSLAHEQAKEATQATRRLQGEFVDQQLAALSPLFVELYQRLRPHIDWQNVRYNLRGDVRKMLSLDVGKGVNPNFVFSSGQRRAAGLAFLLALHLSRSWCQLETLMLDDPVQHVDDYRALHLTEVLAAIRRTGRQVICTVEDQALGELLARRLRSQMNDPGVIVSLVYESGKGAREAERRRIPPLANRVLLAG